MAFTVNGTDRHVEPEPARPLLTVLRDEFGLTGAKYGCGEGSCGACTVLLDGRPVRSCVVMLDDVEGRAVTTVEGLATAGPNALQGAFLEEDAMQCGYCIPGMLMSATALLHETPDPDDTQIREALEGNICRCCTYPRILRAIRRVASLTEATQETRVDATSAGAADLPAPPDAPWDLLLPEARDHFAVLPDGLVVVWPPGRAPEGDWSTTDDAWLHIGADGLVTAFTGKVDVGQGNRTALCLLVAEELRTRAHGVRLVMADTDLCPFDMGTFGSRSMPDAGARLRLTAAAARGVLVARAAERLGVPEGRLLAADAHVSDPDTGRTIAYGELVAGLRRVVVAPDDVPITAASSWSVAGRDAKKQLATEVVTGARRYPSDRAVPGMLHGAILHAPAQGATLQWVDTSRARAMAEVAVVEEDGFVGVTAPTPTAVRAALRAIEPRWDVPPLPDEGHLAEHLRSHPIEADGWAGAIHEETGDVDAALAEADVTLTATYATAYIAHVPLEPRAALAEWGGNGRLTVWTGTQRPFGVREQLAEALDVDERRVRVIASTTGAGFGGKHTGEAAIEAARLARTSGRPVKVCWTREDEFVGGYVRPAAVIDVRSGVGADGTLVAWDFTNINSGAAGLEGPYDVPNQRIAFQPAASPLRQGSYRALAATANHFARECHVDEVAERVGDDPLAYRLRHLSDERLTAVLNAAADRAGWPGAEGSGHGIGIAGGREKDAYVATCAEVQVEPDGRLRILRIVTTFDCGAVVDPRNLTNQIEGATVMGLGAALFEAVHLGDGTIADPSLSSYRVPRFSDVPPIEAVVLDRKDIDPAGAGETPIVAVAPAVANAIFAATGSRIRSMPLAPEGVVG